ncbi:MAG: hypothetical protein WAL45_07050 [Terracidiphilus sp.]
MKLEFDVGMLWLIPVGIALWFMVWVLWSWWREERRQGRGRSQSFGASGHHQRGW